MQAQAVYTDADVKKLLQTVRIVTDTREQNNKHITDYLNKRGIDTESRKLDVGDYAALLPADPSMGIVTDMLFPMRIERKNSID
ncbi:ERCC4 domain-containing protein, partial [Marinococcus halophilus]